MCIGDRVKAGAYFVKVMATGGGLTPNTSPREAQCDEAQMKAIVADSARLGRYDRSIVDGPIGRIDDEDTDHHRANQHDNAGERQPRHRQVTAASPRRPACRLADPPPDERCAEIGHAMPRIVHPPVEQPMGNGLLTASAHSRQNTSASPKGGR